MSLKHTWALVIKNDSGAQVVSESTIITGDGEINFQTPVGAGATVEIDLTIDVSKIKSAFITSDKDVVVKTNAADASGGQTINVTGGTSVSWNDGMTTDNPFDPDITKFFINNAGDQTANVRGGFLLDA